MSVQSFRDIKFKFKNFAGIDTCEFSLARMTLISGPNSSGKTYIVYAIYSFLKNLRTFLINPQAISAAQAQRLLSEGLVQVDLEKFFDKENFSNSVSDNFSNELSNFFSVEDGFFKGAEVKVDIPLPELTSSEYSRQFELRKSVVLIFSKPAGTAACSISISGSREGMALPFLRRVIVANVVEMLFADLLSSDPFAITSERTGISLFWKELDINKNQIIEKLLSFGNKKMDAWEFVDAQTSRYALPITDNIEIARDADNVSKSKSFIATTESYHGYICSIFDEISGGRYRYSKEGISFEYAAGKKRKRIPIYVASSSTKSLFLLDLFINHVASPNSLLVFDEPELNLHPASQRLMAQLLARLVSIGVNVLITTHSDFLIREINNRIMLNKEFEARGDLLNRFSIDDKERIDASDIKGYLLQKNRKLVSVEVTDQGIDMSSINEAIVGAVALQSAIVNELTRE